MPSPHQRWLTYDPASGCRLVATPTRRRLIDGALEVIGRRGITRHLGPGTAAEAGVNQALIFYHFGSVSRLLAQACQQATDERIRRYRERPDAVASFDKLLDLGRFLHADERELGTSPSWRSCSPAPSATRARRGGL